MPACVAARDQAVEDRGNPGVRPELGAGGQPHRRSRSRGTAAAPISANISPNEHAGGRALGCRELLAQEHRGVDDRRNQEQQHLRLPVQAELREREGQQRRR